MKSFLLIIVALASLACGTTEPLDAAVGTYTLVSVQGVAVPAPGFSGQDSVLSGNVQLTSDHRYVLQATTRDFTTLGRPIVIISDTGTWSRTGQSVEYVNSSGSHPGTYNAGILTLVVVVDAWEFRKQLRP